MIFGWLGGGRKHRKAGAIALQTNKLNMRLVGHIGEGSLVEAYTCLCGCTIVAGTDFGTHPFPFDRAGFKWNGGRTPDADETHHERAVVWSCFCISNARALGICVGGCLIPFWMLSPLSSMCVSGEYVLQEIATFCAPDDKDDQTTV